MLGCKDMVEWMLQNKSLEQKGNGDRKRSKLRTDYQPKLQSESLANLRQDLHKAVGAEGWEDEAVSKNNPLCRRVG